MKMIKSIRFILLLSTVVYSCVSKNNERNKLIFIDKINSVQDSLIMMEDMLSKLPKRNDHLNKNYYIEEGSLYINDSLILENFTNSNLYSSIYSKKEKLDFIRVSKFLNRNFLSRAYFDQVDKRWRFIYREYPEMTFHDTRDVCIIDNTDISFVQDDVILDQKGKMYLVAPRDAVIR